VQAKVEKRMVLIKML